MVVQASIIAPPIREKPLPGIRQGLVIMPPLSSAGELARHVKRLRGRRTAAPLTALDRWRLIRDIGPASRPPAREFREPVGKGLVLPPRDVFLK